MYIVLKFQESFTHAAMQNDIKQFMDEDINFDETSINNATNKLHCIFEKVCKASLKRKKRVKAKGNKWYDSDLSSLKKLVDEKAFLMSVVCGSFYKLNKRYAKTRKKKRREFKQNILNHLDELQSNNPKEIWSLVNQLCNEQSDKSVSNIDGDTWYKYFSILASVPNNFKSRLHKIKNKLKLLEEGNINFSPRA